MVNAADAKKWAREHVVGLWCSPLTPFEPDASKIKYEALDANVEHIMEIGVEGMGYGHSEPWCMSHEERRDSAAHFVKSVARRVPTYIHAFDHSAPETVNFVRHASEIGADLVMIEPPYEHAKTEEMIFQYYKYVTDRTDIGIILLNTPHSGRLMSPELVDRLCDLDAVCAMKSGISDFAFSMAVHDRVGDRLVFSHPHEASALPAIIHLGQQVQLGTSGIYLQQAPDWRPVRAYFEAARSGDHERAWEIFSALAPIRDLFNEMVSSIWTEFPEHPIATQKVWMEAIGMYGGPVRLPLRNLTEAERGDWTRRVKENHEKARSHPALASL